MDLNVNLSNGVEAIDNLVNTLRSEIAERQVILDRLSPPPAPAPVPEVKVKRKRTRGPVLTPEQLVAAKAELATALPTTFSSTTAIQAGQKLGLNRAKVREILDTAVKAKTLIQTAARNGPKAAVYEKVLKSTKKADPVAA